jgi:phosphatidylserine/phosphatidylglycerophosphate/cardiolipin synthase-like enzyme
LEIRLLTAQPGGTQETMKALFSSNLNHDQMQGYLLQTLNQVHVMAEARAIQIDVHIMIFAFTDKCVADLLEQIARNHPLVTIRIIADWGQGSASRGQQVPRLAKLGLSNLLVRYKKDQPYRWDVIRQQIRWSYHASRGLLHHKTLGILIDGRPWKLICGSFNWTAKAANSYENLLVFLADEIESCNLMSRFELEFEAMWADGQTTVSPEEAVNHYQNIIEEYKINPVKPPELIAGLTAGEVKGLQTLHDEARDLLKKDETPLNTRLLIAFSSRSFIERSGQCGYSEQNRIQKIYLTKHSGKIKRVPLTLTTLALDFIFRAKTGHSLKIAFYALSSRVPEYGALLDAARRGVRLFVILDGKVGITMLSRLVAIRNKENLPIELRAGCRTMHQKYLIHPQTYSVLTGTANMSTDASNRHSEHRILIRENPSVAESFLNDFDTLWARLGTIR